MWALCVHSSSSNTYIWVVQGTACTYEQKGKDACYDEIGLFAQNIDTTLGSKVNTIGDACVIT